MSLMISVRHQISSKAFEELNPLRYFHGIDNNIM